MGNKKALDKFAGATHVKPAGSLCKKGLSSLMRRLGIEEQMDVDTFKDSSFEVRDTCPDNGIKLTVKKDGRTKGIWVASRKVEPVKAQAAS